MNNIKHDQAPPRAIWLYKYPNPWGGVTASDGSYHLFMGGLSNIAMLERAKNEETESIEYIRADTLQRRPDADDAD